MSDVSTATPRLVLVTKAPWRAILVSMGQNPDTIPIKVKAQKKQNRVIIQNYTKRSDKMLYLIPFVEKGATTAVDATMLLVFGVQK
jgi:hypothetical protein